MRSEIPPFNFFSLVLISLLALLSCQGPSLKKSHDIGPPLSLSQKVLPQARQAKSDIFLDQVYFQISYNQTHRLPNWVSYRLTVEPAARKMAQRKNRFFADPQLKEQGIAFAKPTDFVGKVYDRGHMAPSEDFVWSQAANDATFVMTNMAPQSRALNRGAWKKLEATVRKWACTEGSVRVVSGPILKEKLAHMPSQVSVPQEFFKVVLDETAPRKVAAFIFSQEDGSVDFKSRLVSLKQLEEMSGLSFFLDLEPSERQRLEKARDIGDWKESNCFVKGNGT